MIDELPVGPRLHNRSGADHVDAIRMADGREAVRDCDNRPIVGNPGEGALDRSLGLVVDGGGRFVEQQDGRVGEQRSRNREALPLAA